MSEVIDIRVAEGQQEGTTSVVQSWLKQPGDTVAEHEPVAELETDKVVVEVAAPAAGVLKEILKQAGEDVQPGEIVGRISRAGEAVTSAPDAVVPATSAGNADETPRLKLSPVVRRMVKEHDLDPFQITGTGKGGRLTAGDVQAYLESIGQADSAAKHAPQPEPVADRAPPRAPVPPAASKPLPVTPLAGPIAGRRVPHTTMRKRIADHMVESLLHTAPHVTSVFELDMSAVMAHRRVHKDAWAEQGVNLTLTAYFIAASCEALREVPEVNSRFHEDGLELFDDVNIGVGTALGDKGLVVPVLHQVQRQNLMGIAAKLQELTRKARDGSLAPADVQNGTFTISNHGVSGSLLAAPIVINQPQSAILGVGKLEKRVVVRTVDGQDTLQIRPMCYVTLTIDHRVLDAHQTNAFLARMVRAMETWK